MVPYAKRSVENGKCPLQASPLDCGSLLPLWRASLGERGGSGDNSSASFGMESGSELPQSRVVHGTLDTSGANISASRRW